MDTHRTCQLGDTSDRQLNLLTSCHDQIAELIDDDHDIGHESVSAAWWNPAFDEFLVILLDISCAYLFQQIVTGVHQFAERVQRTNHLGDVGDDGIGVLVGHLRQEVVDQRIVDGELHLLRVYKHNLHLCGMLLVEQRGDDGVQTD